MGFLSANFQLPMPFRSRLKIRHGTDRRTNRRTDRRQPSTLNAPPMLLGHNKTRNSAIVDKPRDAFRGQSRSPNTVPFHVLRMVSYYCAIVILSVRQVRYLTSKNVVTLKTVLSVREGH